MTVKQPARLPEDWSPPTMDDVSQLAVAVDQDGVRRCHDVQYAILPGYRPLLLDLAVPTRRSGPAPLVVFIHGGAWEAGTKDFREDDLDDLRLVAERLLTQGVAVASVQYRLSGEAVFPAQLVDVHAAIDWLRSSSTHLSLDPDRIGVIGESAGGHLALLAGTNVSVQGLGLRHPDPDASDESPSIAACVAWYAPTSLDTMQRNGEADGFDTDHSSPDAPESRLIGVPVEDDRELALLASPIAHVSGRTAPTLLIHGRADSLVSYRQSVAYDDVLAAHDVTSQLLVIDGADHCFFGADVDAVVSTTVDFLTTHLEGRPLPTHPHDGADPTTTRKVPDA